MIKIRKKQFNDNAVPFIDCLNEKSLEALNRPFNTHYSHKSVRKDIRVRRAEKEPSFWKKLMEEGTEVRL